MSNAAYNLCVNMSGTSPVGTTYIPVLWTTDANGGGITITNATFSARNAVAAASAGQFELVTLGTNSAVNGTIGTALGSAAFTAGTARAMSLTSSPFVDPPYALAVKWIQTAANGDEVLYTGQIQYLLGK